MVWVRCADIHRRYSFWGVIVFLRDITKDADARRSLFSGVFSELVGLPRELTHPQVSRRCVWFSGDATPTRIGGIDWDQRTYFAVGHYEVLRGFPPSGRETAHISENEFLAEIPRTVLWGETEASLLLLGVTDNTTANMWFSKGRARRGVGLRLTRAFHRWGRNNLSDSDRSTVDLNTTYRQILYPGQRWRSG